MPIDFPNSPANGATYTVGTKTWQFDGTTWNVVQGDALIGTGSVTSDKIAAGAVVEAGLGTGAVTVNKIGSGAVTTAKLASGAVTATELGSGAVTTAKIAAGAVTTTELGNNAVTQAKMASTVSAVTICTSTTRPASPFDGQFAYETDTDLFLVYEGASWQTVKTSSGPMFKANLSASASVAHSAVIPFNVATTNVGNCYNTSNYRFTAPVSGNYMFGGMLRIDADIPYIHLIVRVNGVNATESGDLPALIGSGGSGVGFTAGCWTYMKQVTAGQYVDFIIFWQSGGPYNLHQQSYYYGYLMR